MTWVVDELDVRVATTLCARTGAAEPPLRTLAALAAAAPRDGHVCVDLDAVDGPVVLERPSPTGAGMAPAPEELPSLGDVRPLLVRAVATELARTADQPHRVTPLVVDDSRVYLDRYWSYEDRLRGELTRRSDAAVAPEDPTVVSSVLDLVAPHDETGPAVDRQRLAVAQALVRPLSVLSGGPGTGKTHTVVSILAGLVVLADLRGDAPPRIAIAAPTGKAAARLEQAMAEAAAERELPALATDALGRLRRRTVHGLLGYQRRSPTRFRHDAANRLPHDVVVIDEASMVQLSLMTKLVEAVRDDATLVLVGDRDQLVSVEAGAVLGDVCGPTPAGSSLRLSAGWAAVLEEVTGAPVGAEADVLPHPGVWDGIVQLERFRRFGVDTGIGAVARAIQRADAPGAPANVVDLLRGDAVEDGAPTTSYDDVELVGADPGPALPAVLRDTVVAAITPYLDAVEAAGAVADAADEAAGAAADADGVLAVDEAAGAVADTTGAVADATDGAVAEAADGPFLAAARAALEAFDAVRVLCAVREGPLGVSIVGATVERWIAEADPRLRPDDGWYPGRPVLVTRNDHDLGIMNGDVGVTLRRRGRLVVAFALADGSIRTLPVSRVTDCESVWAMTIHKSQGSQFRHAIVVLPDRDAGIVTRELVYTGVTRARDRMTIVADVGRLRDALSRPVRRATGLRQRLWVERPRD